MPENVDTLEMDELYTFIGDKKQNLQPDLESQLHTKRLRISGDAI